MRNVYLISLQRRQAMVQYTLHVYWVWLSFNVFASPPISENSHDQNGHIGNIPTYNCVYVCNNNIAPLYM